MRNIRTTRFLLIVLASFLLLQKSARVFGLSIFNRDVKIVLTGDVMLGRSVMAKSLKEKDNAYPFRKIADELSSADLVFVNLENPFVDNCPQTDTGMIFCASPGLVEGLTLAGVDIASLANNHSRNYGQKGLNSTVNVLGENDIEVVGLDKFVVKKIRGTKYGFLGFDFLTKMPKETDYNLIQESKNKVDVLIAGIHWGNEYAGKPTRYQKEWARKIVEKGVDVIVGHHPHWVQESEIIDGKPVYYSLGNLVFDQMWSKKTREGLIVELTFRGGELKNIEELPIYMTSWAQPEFVNQ